MAREIEPWLKSWYKQLVANPPNPKFDYATSLPYETFRELPRVQRLTNIPALQDDLKTFFGANEVLTGNYEADWTSAFLSLLAVGHPPTESGLRSVHESISDDLAELIRQVNAMRLENEDRASFLAWHQSRLRTNNQTLQEYQLAYPVEGGSAKTVETLKRLVPQRPGQAALIDILNDGFTDRSDH